MQFKRYGIGSIFNLQEPGEHAICGPGIKAITGLSYSPEMFMDKNGKLTIAKEFFSKIHLLFMT